MNAPLRTLGEVLAERSSPELVATLADRLSVAVAALTKIKMNAQFAQAGGALFSLERCVALCDKALAEAQGERS